MPPGCTAALPDVPAPPYVGPGVSTLLIRGFTPLADARDYGTLVRLVREQAGPAALVSAR
jgi:alkanesulfonate monooxygenase